MSHRASLHPLSAGRATSRPRAIPAPRALESARARLGFLALQDLVLVAYYAIVLLVLRATAASPSVELDACTYRAGFALLVTVGGAFVARGPLPLPTWARAVVYRVCLVGALVYSYLMLRDLLPLIRQDSVDAALHAIDLRVFGVEPALWLQRYNERPFVEWFSFFYFSYFWIGAAWMVGMIWVRKHDRATSELAIGVLLVYGLGQLGYMAVPGLGPVHHLANQFERPLQGGLFWRLVSETVAAGGANKDVFPSLHTAAPTFFAMFAWRARHTDRRFLPIAIVTTFFAANIVVSTMFLRWHFAVDVAAGLALATFARLAAPRLAAADERWRARRGLALPWDFTAPRSGAAGGHVGTSGSRSTSDTITSRPGTAPASRAPIRPR